MKTTVEIGGYEIVIEHLEDEVKVTAMQDGEVIEEFTLESSDDSKKGEDLESYDDFEEEEDFESDDDDDEDSDDDDDEDEAQMKKGKMQSQAQAQSEPQVQGTLESFQSFIAGKNIRSNISQGMPNMKSGSRRVREHVEDIIFRTGRIVLCFKGMVIHPELLPLFFYFCEIVIH